MKEHNEAVVEKRRGGGKKGQVYKKRKPYELRVCEWCGSTGKGNVFLRWHHDRCKMKPKTTEGDTDVH